MYPVALLSLSDQHFAEAATYAAHNKPKRRTSTASTGFELAIPATKLLET
jgi:hypothetical protein